MKYVNTALSWLLVFLIAHLIVLEFFSNKLLSLNLELGIVLLLIGAILTAKTYSRWISVALTAAGGIIYLISEASPGEMLEGFSFNFEIVGIILVVPVIGIALKTGGYLDALREMMLLQREKRKSKSYTIAYLLTMALGPFLNVGVVQIVNELAHHSLDRFHQKRMGMVLFRGCASALYWSPFGGMVILTLELLDVRWFSVLGFLLIGALCHVLLSVILFKSTVYDNDVWVDQSANPTEMSEKQIKRKVAVLILMMMGLIVVAVALEMIAHISMVTNIIMLSIGYCFLWMAVVGKAKPFAANIQQYMGRAFLSVRTEILLFVSAGFFASAVSQSPLNNSVAALFETIISLPIIVFIMALFSLFIIMGFVGIHGVILLTLVGASLEPAAYGWNIFFLPTALMFAAILYQQTSPFSALMVMVSKLMNTTPAEVIRSNLRFIVSLYCVLGFILWCISLI